MARQNFIGIVLTQGKMSKTVKVRVQGKVFDKRIGKEILRRKDFLVHDEGEICKEGDVVRIESIPKRSKRKAFAIAEIKVNKGQQFEAYERMALKKVKDEEKQHKEDSEKHSEEFQSTIEHLNDLKSLDVLRHRLVIAEPTDRHLLKEEIKRIKKKYNITSWPSTNPGIELDLNKLEFKNVTDKRLYYIQRILYEIMNDEKHLEWKNKIVEQQLNKKPNQVSNSIQKNVIRKYILNPSNECPVKLP